MNNKNPLEHSCEQCCCCDNCPFSYPKLHLHSAWGPLWHKHESSEGRLGKQEEFIGSKQKNRSAESKMGASEDFKGKRSRTRD